MVNFGKIQQQSKICLGQIRCYSNSGINSYAVVTFLLLDMLGVFYFRADT